MDTTKDEREDARLRAAWMRPLHRRSGGRARKKMGTLCTCALRGLEQIISKQSAGMQGPCDKQNPDQLAPSACVQ